MMEYSHVSGGSVKGMVTIYALCEPDTRAVRYVGKAIDLPSRLRSHAWEIRNPKIHTRKVNWLRSLSGVPPIVKVLCLVSHESWSDAERFWIAEMRERGCDLTNYANGGQTSPVEGKGHTKETKARLSAKAIERGWRPPSRAGSVPWNKGSRGLMKANKTTFKRTQPPWNKGKTMSADYIEKNRQCHKGIPWSAARRAAQERRNAAKVGAE